MRIIFSSSIKNYLEKVEPLLLRKEASNNLMLGLLEYFKTTMSRDVYCGYMEDEGEVIYAFMQTAPNNWILADVDHVDDQLFFNLASFFYKKAIKVPGILGPIHHVEWFVREWLKYKKVKASIKMNQCIYQLNEVRVKPSSNGELVKATKTEHELIKSWLIQFGRETNENPITEIRASQMATKYIENESLYLWKVDERPVSMANQSRRTKNGVSINAVFTPDEFKRNGYATNVVAALSQRLLDQGYQFCSLYTDRENPTSNKIYTNIGFEVVGSSVVYEFT
jgi:uncharacterized protein